MPTAAFSGPFNTFIPTFDGETTANLIVSYSRDPKKFAVNRLAQITPVKRTNGFWLKLKPDALARRIGDPAASIWIDGQERPQGPHNKQDYLAVAYSCTRYSDPYPVGYMEDEQAAWPLKQQAAGALAHMAMTRRAIAFYNVATNSANHLASHVKTATQAGGGLWGVATGTNPYIQQSLLYVGDTINSDTMAGVDYTDLTLVLSPTAARKAAVTQEIRDYIAHSPDAVSQIRGDKPGQNGMWGLPDRLYGMKVEVDPTIKNTAKRLADATNVHTLDDNTALVVCRPGEVPDGTTQVASAFSSIHFFIYGGDEMKTEVEDQPINRRTVTHVSDNYDCKFVATETAFLLTNLFS